MGKIEQVFQVESFCDDDNGACGFDCGEAGAVYIANLARELNKDSVTLVVPTKNHEFYIDQKSGLAIFYTITVKTIKFNRRTLHDRVIWRSCNRRFIS